MDPRHLQQRLPGAVARRPRVFAVGVDGHAVLPRVDVVAATGARRCAMGREVPVTVGPAGAVTVSPPRADPDNPFLRARRQVSFMRASLAAAPDPAHPYDHPTGPE